MPTIRVSVLKKINATNPEALESIYNAMVDDLMEREQPQDEAMCRYYLGMAADGYEGWLSKITHFPAIVDRTEFLYLRAYAKKLRAAKDNH